jgi:hypothetical protein
MTNRQQGASQLAHLLAGADEVLAPNYVNLAMAGGDLAATSAALKEQQFDD